MNNGELCKTEKNQRISRGKRARGVENFRHIDESKHYPH